MINYFRQVFIICKKDIFIELKSFSNISSVLVISLLMSIIFGISQNGEESSHVVRLGLYWASIVFYSNILILKSIAQETGTGSLTAILLEVSDKSIVIVAKILYTFIISSFAGFFLLLFFGLLLNDFIVIKNIDFVYIIVGIFAISVITNFLAFISIHTRYRESVLTVLQLPAIMPIILSSTQGMNSDVFISFTMTIIISYSIIAVILSIALYPIVAQD